MKQIPALSLLACTFAGTPALAQTSIDEIAPENTVFIAQVADVHASTERFSRTALHGLINDPALRERREKWNEEFNERLEKALTPLGLTPEDLSLPTGGVGLAVFPVMDEETGRPAPGFIAFADFGTQAEQMKEAFITAIERAERDRHIEYDVLDILGREVYALEFLREEPEVDLDEFDFGMPPPGDPFDEMRKIHVVRNGDAFILASDLGALTESLDRLDTGEAPLTRRTDYMDLLGQVGAHDGYALLLTRDLMHVAQAGDPMGMAPMFAPTLKALLGDIRGVAASLRLDGPQAMIEGRGALYMPEGKGGLTELIDISSPRSDPPAFVGPDAISYSRMHFRFDRLARVLADAIESNPMMGMMMGPEVIEIIEGPVHDVLSTLGTQIDSAGTLRRPLTAASSGTLFAVELVEAERFEDLFGTYAPQMGLEPREFLGQRIYTSPPGPMLMMMGMESLSVGVGAGQVFAGSTELVEQALRSAIAGERMPHLGEEPDFRQAVEALGGQQVVSWGYLDLVSTIESLTVGQMAQREMMEQMRRQHPEWAREMEQHEDDEMPEIDYDLLRRYLGPISWEMRSTDQGFVAGSFLLPAEEARR